MAGRGRPKTGTALNVEERGAANLTIRCKTPDEKATLAKRLKVLSAATGRRLPEVIIEALDTLEAR
jgi:hypothetical protein